MANPRSGSGNVQDKPEISYCATEQGGVQKTVDLLSHKDTGISLKEPLWLNLGQFMHQNK